MRYYPVSRLLKKSHKPPALPPVKLEGPRIIVRPPGYEDGEIWLELRRKNRAYLEPFEPAWPADALTLDHFNRRLTRQITDWKGGRTRSFLIFSRVDDAMIGGINMNNISLGAAQFASLGYWIAEDRQGQGFMQEALQLVAHFAFTDLKLHRLNAGCLPHNRRSRNLLLKAGFREEGYAEKYLEIQGQWQDHVLYGLPVENWREMIETALKRDQLLRTASQGRTPAT